MNQSGLSLLKLACHIYTAHSQKTVALTVARCLEVAVGRPGHANTFGISFILHLEFQEYHEFRCFQSGECVNILGDSIDSSHCC